MGEEYRAILEEKLRSMAGVNIRVFIDDAAVSPHYRKHLEDTVMGAGASIVATRAQANVVFGKEAESSLTPGVLFAFIAGGQMHFQGAAV